MNTLTVQQALEDAAIRLKPTHDSARLDAEVLLAFVLNRSRTWLHTWPEHQLENAEAKQFDTLVKRRINGEPVAHLTGRREFWSLELEVSDQTLIPRPETETLVEQALACIPPSAPYLIADIGTGSGAIALAIASERPACTILATDQSLAALEIAARNAQRLQIAHVEFVRSNWGDCIASASLDCIVSNPPYVSAGDPHLTRGDVRFEPHSALVSGVDGLDALRDIVRSARRCLKPGGALLIEHADVQAEAIVALVKDYGYIEVNQQRDVLGQLRVSSARLPAPTA